MKMPLPPILIASCLLLLVTYSAPTRAQCAGFEYCNLVWSDEFDGTEVDTNKWSFQLGDGTEVGLPSGWGNGEQQWYTQENATVADGMLAITARKEMLAPGFPYSSARLRSIYKGDWTYGRMEMRAKMPIGKGLWPAFWMLPTSLTYGVWAASGEIDVMEYIGSEPDTVFGTIHYGGEWPSQTFSSTKYQLADSTFDQDFHVFAVEWEADEFRWYVDDVHYATQTSWRSSNGPFPAPFDVDFHLLLNMAVGGNLPGFPGSDTVFPQQLLVDYVRVYQEAEPPGFTINPGLNDAWFNSATDGQGFLISVFPDINSMFLAWFTYDTERPPEGTEAKLGEPGHRWLTAQGPISGNTANLTVYSTSGGVFDSAEPPAVTDPEGIGVMTVEFADCREGLITYEITSPEISGQIPIQRIVEDNVALCEVLSESGGEE